MTIMGFGYDEILESDVPLTVEFDKENKKCSAFYTTLVNYDNAFIIVKNEAILEVGMNVLFMLDYGLIQSNIVKIDYDKKKIKVGKTWITPKDTILSIGINDSNFTENDLQQAVDDYLNDCLDDGEEDLDFE